MEPLRQVALVYQQALPTEPLVEKLREHFIVEEVGRDCGPQVFYDTFDWRLHRQQTLCVGIDQRLLLLTFDGTLIDELDGMEAGQRFWWQMPPSEARERLREIIDVRALLPMASLVTDSRQFRLLNRDEKTVVTLTIRADEPVAGTAQDRLPEMVVITELRGYRGAFDKVVQLSTASGLTPVDAGCWLAQRGFTGACRVPLDYGDKFRVELDPEIDVGSAIAQICRHLLAEVDINRDGVFDDIDSEFLHDFRIAIRRTRSMLSLLKKQFPAKECAFFRREFKWLGGVTGELRDIDVYLLQKEAYLAMLPPRLRPGLDGFFAELEVRRLRELKLLRRHLSSKRFAKLISAWRAFISDDDSALLSELSGRPCRQLADRIIRKRFRAFRCSGGAITDTSPDSDMHQLRIKGKKLRYLLEFFRSLYEEQHLEQFVKQMKKLQDNLGDFNDLCVQETMLGARLDGIGGRGRGALRQAAALGGLLTVSARKRAALRNDFASIFAGFSSPENEELLTSLIGEGRQPA
ncbi:MAG: CHAD domain-containing protein, partial [Desulfofustis sp.]|nr:CHAD domain-containing protein [Desulfofustis sp.]